MKVSVNWLREYTDLDTTVKELVERIGAQLGGVDEVIDLGRKYQGIIIARVVSCAKHPNADKLSICKIDDNGVAKDVARDKNSYIQVVCGAPNVREGLLVAWLPPGSTVPATFDKDPFVLEARELRGQISNGMLASASELGISDDHSGILELPDDQAKAGDDFAKTFGLDDHIIDIENKMFTHRPDLFGVLGVAREVAGIHQKQFNSPAWYNINPKFPGLESSELKLVVKNELEELVPRFCAITISHIKVKPSPLWLQIILVKLGMKPINNIVDLTNYYMYLTGQPLHAYDYDKVKARSKGEATLVVRKPKKDEKIKLLSGKEIKPRSEAIMIATDKELIGIGGVMGGADTEVDETTTSIILECANFDMYSIRRSAMEHGLFTDAVTRFTKGQSPLQNLAILAKITDEICNMGGKIASSLVDTAKDLRPPIAVNVTAEFINLRLGLELIPKEMAALLTNVEFEVAVNGPNLVVAPPFWRTDIEIPEDVVEEVGRLYGYDHLPQDLPVRGIVPVGPDNTLELKSRLRHKLSSLGANEVLTYSFVHGNLFEKTGQDKSIAFKLSNALSPDLQYYRLSLTPSLLDKIHMNIKAGHSRFAIFEIGKVHSVTEFEESGVPREFERLAMVYASTGSINDQGAAFYQARAYLDQLADHKVVPFDKKLLLDHKVMQQIVTPYDEARSAMIWNGKMFVGIIGEFKPEVVKKFKLPEHSAGIEMFISALKNSRKPAYKPLSRFPITTQDITLKVSSDQSFAQISSAVSDLLDTAKPRDVNVNVEPRDIFQSSDDAAFKHLTFRIFAGSYERTLVTENLSEMLDKVSKQLAESLGAERI